MKEIIISTEYAGGRFDKFLFKYLNFASKNFVYKMLRKKNITLNDKKAVGNEILNDGDVVKLFLADDTIDTFRKDNAISLNSFDNQRVNIINKIICYEDDNIIILNKPFGILSQKAKYSDYSLNEMLFEYLTLKKNPSNKDDVFDFKSGISNRLDRNTTGIIIAGKNLNATRTLNDAIKNRLLAKKYLCVVNGVLEESKTIQGYLFKNKQTNTVSVFENNFNGQGKKIITTYTPLSNNGKLTLVEINLITGKSHQIRAHLASIGFPLIGDNKYGDVFTNHFYKNKYHIEAQLLHAYKVQFNNIKDPLAYLNGLNVRADLPDYFLNLIKSEGLWLLGIAEDLEDLN